MWLCWGFGAQQLQQILDLMSQVGDAISDLPDPIEQEDIDGQSTQLGKDLQGDVSQFYRRCSVYQLGIQNTDAHKKI